jgi:hypothetical protein
MAPEKMTDSSAPATPDTTTIASISALITDFIGRSRFRRRSMRPRYICKKKQQDDRYFEP